MIPARHLVALALSGCGGTAPAKAVDLCDGSPAMRLAVRTVVDPGRLEIGQQVLFDNGGWFLFVDGACGVHVKTSDDWAPVAYATLQEPAALADELEMARWGEWAGTYQGDAMDGSTVVFEDGVAGIACTSGCSGVEDHIATLSDVAYGWIEDLASEAEPVTGPVRLTVVRYEDGLDVEALEWPLAVDLDDVAIDEVDVPIEFGVGTLVEGEDAEILRTVREEFPPGEEGRFGGFIPFRAPGEQEARYRAYFRDVLPFEGPDGIVPWFHQE